MVINHNKDNKEISKLILKDNLRYDQDNIGIFIYFNRMQSKHSLLISLYLPQRKEGTRYPKWKQLNSNPLPNPIASANKMLIPYEAWTPLLCVCVCNDQVSCILNINCICIRVISIVQCLCPSPWFTVDSST